MTKLIVNMVPLAAFMVFVAFVAWLIVEPGRPSFTDKIESVIIKGAKVGYDCHAAGTPWSACEEGLRRRLNGESESK